MSQIGAKTINFAGHAANSPQFDALYAEGMNLVETTAAYLDGQGRKAAKTLPSHAASLYSAESIRLTTRLMQLASWLLLQRSLNTGEMTREQVLQERRKLRLNEGGINRNTAGWSDLPEGFQELVEASQRLESRIRILDDNLMQESAEGDTCESANENQVIAQIDLLQTAFGRR
ncbi:DUF1465 family protein [Martelella mediterranea]|uniref:Regulator of CtrA degradation n=1 Tax=Martelella mediterranea TaxID=293089 RepID=A0A4R3NWU7_9HYPH|nr:DUF1465 family protein [Martelella mediterranea]TCT42843.1 regulator of CtrA degradation [Martelella mediterranea]